MKGDLVPFSDVDWDRLDKFEDRTVFQTREWLEFVAETQNARPVVLELRDNSAIVGYFSGLTFTAFGVKILASWFPGWTTPYMGFNLLPGIPRAAALAAVEEAAFGKLRCLHLEVCDPCFSPEDGRGLGFACESFPTYRTDLRKSEADIFNGMTSACRRCIRKAEKCGVVVEEAHDLGFADEYYEQLKEVYAKQRLVPSYGIDRVRALIKHLEPTGRLLLLRARDPHGRCIATGLFPGFNKMAEFWGAASFQSGQILRPNETIQWYAMRYWKSRGLETYDWGGENPYKEKYGCVPFSAPRFSKSRYKLLAKLRDGMQKVMQGRQSLLGLVTRQIARARSTDADAPPGASNED
ncbi:MAG TPA: GNAT family N-acetyltransferase [Terriglobia bacterium]|nr:GNAT family N-acetyltransferase [Terriglobia bacterium]